MDLYLYVVNIIFAKQWVFPQYCAKNDIKGIMLDWWFQKLIQHQKKKTRKKQKNSRVSI